MHEKKSPVQPHAKRDTVLTIWQKIREFRLKVKWNNFFGGKSVCLAAYSSVVSTGLFRQMVSTLFVPNFPESPLEKIVETVHYMYLQR